MNSSLLRVCSAALLFGTACANATQVNRSAAPGAPAPTGASSSDARYAAKARADSARYPYTKADIAFMTGMIAHHGQAIRMSVLAPTHGASPSVRTLADRIINAQTDEITLMQRWLRDRGQPVPDPKSGAMHAMPGMEGMEGMDHETLMPGMLTEAQMQALDAAKGADFDRLFLTGMIQHHKGAVSMVKTLFDTYGAAQDELVFKFASDVNVDQTTEIARMQQMLAMMTILGHAP